MTTNFKNLPPTVDSLVVILQRLRDPENGCPWDKIQTRETLARCMTEELAEYLEALETRNTAAMCDELGDLLMNVVFQAVVAEEEKDFTLRDALDNINRKLIRRHAHIFGDEHAESATDVVQIWEKIKSQEKDHQSRKSLLDGIPAELSGLNYAEKIQKRAAKAGFDWTSQDAIVAKLDEEVAEFKTALARHDEENADEELGDILFVIANLTRFRKRRTSEELLRMTNRKFTERFHYIEEELARRGIPVESAGIELMESLWQEAKHRK